MLDIKLIFENVSKNKTELLNSYLHSFELSIKENEWISYFNYIYVDNDELKLDKTKFEDLIRSAIDSKNCPSFISQRHGIQFKYNVKNYFSSDENYLISLGRDKYVSNFNKLLDKVFISFFSKNENQLLLDKFSEVNLLDNSLIAEEKVMNRFYIARSFSYIDVENWCRFIKDLFVLNFPDFELDIYSNPGVVRFYRKVKEDFYFGFEYDVKGLKREVKIGKLDLSSIELVSVFVFTKDFDRRSKPKPYFQFSEGFFVISTLENNLFSDSIDIDTFAILRSHLYFKKSSENELLQLFRPVDIGNGFFKVESNQDWLDEVKKFTIMKLTSESRKIRMFLNYLEKCIVDVL